MLKPASQCVGFTTKKVGLSNNCGNCEHYVKEMCEIRELLDELYIESREGRAMDRMMRGNKGVRIDR